MRALVGVALLAALSSASAAPPVKTPGADLTPPQIVLGTALPAVATSYSMPYAATYSDNVELAYVRSGSSQPFVFMAEGVKTYQADDPLLVPLGQTVSRTLMAVDTSGNVGKRTITISSPEVSFKDGTYAIIGTNRYPTGFDCRPMPQSGGSWDGQVAGTTLKVHYPPTCGAPGTPCTIQQWSVAGGYRPGVVADPNGFNVVAATNIPLNATSYSLETAAYAGAAYPPAGTPIPYEYKLFATAQVIQASPRTVQLTHYIACNVNNVGWINGTTSTFVGQLAP